MPKKYDSKFERELDKTVLKGCNYHPDKKVQYVIEREYEPDWQVGYTLIEAKGRFRDRLEAAKYIWVRKALPKRYKLVFVFQNHKTPMPGARRRKDGTKLSVGEWATKNGFEWYTPRTVPKNWGRK